MVRAMNGSTTGGNQPDMNEDTPATRVEPGAAPRAYERPRVTDHAAPEVSVVFGSVPTAECAGIHKPPPKT